MTPPLVREDGVLRGATWEEALDCAAEGFRRNVAEHGPDNMDSCPAPSVARLSAARQECS